MFFDAVFACFAWAFYSLSAWAGGAWLIHRFFPGFLKDRLAIPGLTLALGMAMLGTIWSALALIPHGLQTWTVLSVLIVALFRGGRDIFHYVRSLDYRALFLADVKLRWVVAPLILFLALTPLMTWNPLGTDALAFYFAQAKLIAYAQQFLPLPGYDAFAQIPLPAELTYSALLLIGPELGARLISATELWGCAALMAALVSACGAGLAGRWLSLLLLLSSTGVTLLISDGKTDLYGGMLGLAVLYVFVASPDLSKRSAVLMGLLTGFAVMGKLSYLPIFVPMLGFLLGWRFYQNRPAGKAAKDFIIVGSIIGGIVVLNALLLMLKNQIFYHEPLAPFLLLDKTKVAAISNEVWFSPEVTRWILKTYPLVWTFGQYPMQHGTLSPLVWGALPALGFVRLRSIDWRHDKALALFIAGLLGMASWAIFFPSTVAPRYIFPALFAFLPLATRGLEMIWGAAANRLWQRRALTAVLTLFSLAALYYGLSEVREAVRWIVYGPSKSYVNYVWEGLQAGEQSLPDGGRLLLLGWERSPLQGKTLSCLVGHDEIGIDGILNGKTNSLDYWQNIYKAGTKVVVVNVVGRKDFATKIDTSNKPAWLNIGEKKINKFYTLYILSGTKSAPAVDTQCALGKDGIWRTGSGISRQ